MRRVLISRVLLLRKGVRRLRRASFEVMQEMDEQTICPRVLQRREASRVAHVPTMARDRCEKERVGRHHVERHRRHGADRIVLGVNDERRAPNRSQPWPRRRDFPILFLAREPPRWAVHAVVEALVLAERGQHVVPKGARARALRERVPVAEEVREERTHDDRQVHTVDQLAAHVLVVFGQVDERRDRHRARELACLARLAHVPQQHAAAHGPADANDRGARQPGAQMREDAAHVAESRGAVRLGRPRDAAQLLPAQAAPVHRRHMPESLAVQQIAQVHNVTHVARVVDPGEADDDSLPIERLRRPGESNCAAVGQRH